MLIGLGVFVLGLWLARTIRRILSRRLFPRLGFEAGASAAAHPRALPQLAPAAVFKDFGDSALLFEIRFWIRYDEQTDRSKIQSDIRFQIDEVFAANEIEIAFPQMDVHLEMVGSGTTPDRT